MLIFQLHNLIFLVLILLPATLIILEYYLIYNKEIAVNQPPGQIINLTYNVIDDNNSIQTTITWQPPLFANSDTVYYYTIYNNGVSITSGSTSSLSISISNLELSQQYIFDIYAKNQYGTGNKNDFKMTICPNGTILGSDGVCYDPEEQCPAGACDRQQIPGTNYTYCYPYYGTEYHCKVNNNDTTFVDGDNCYFYDQQVQNNNNWCTLGGANGAMCCFPANADTGSGFIDNGQKYAIWTIDQLANPSCGTGYSSFQLKCPNGLWPSS